MQTDVLVNDRLPILLPSPSPVSPSWMFEMRNLGGGKCTWIQLKIYSFSKAEALKNGSKGKQTKQL